MGGDDGSRGCGGGSEFGRAGSEVRPEVGPAEGSDVKGLGYI